jgi:Tfp pilus assembly protein PilF
MPPWKPEPGYGAFKDERRLTDRQIAAIQAWVGNGTPRGDPQSLPRRPTSTGRWQRGTPDLVLTTPPYTLHANGDDMYRNFVLPIALTKTRYIKAWEFLPGNRRVVHHATMQLDPIGASKHLDEHDAQPGYEGLIPHAVRSPDGFFLDWTPGHVPYVAPDGMAWPISPGTDLVLMLHLRPSREPETVQASLGLYFSDEPPAKTPTLIRLTRQHLDIPAGESGYVVEDSFTLPTDVDVYTIQPHAHNLAREVRATATLPDGRRQPLIFIKSWEFEWQGVYQYTRPLALPAGTTLSMRYVYDNSSNNPHNPFSPPRRVTYGQRTSDEMAELMIQVVPRRAEQQDSLRRAITASVLPEEIVGHEKMLEQDPNNIALHDGVALLYAQTGNLEGVSRHFAATLRLSPTSAPAHYNLGMSLMMQGRTSEAADLFRQSVAVDANYAAGHYGLGLVAEQRGGSAEALQHYERAVALNPGNADAHAHLGTVLHRVGRLAEARAHYRAALQVDPASPVRQALQNLEKQIEGR